MTGPGRVVADYLAALLDRAGLSAAVLEMREKIGAEFNAAGTRVDFLEKRIEELERWRAALPPGAPAPGDRAPDFAAFMAPTVAAALERQYGVDVEALADELVDGMFRNSFGVADRLVLMTNGGSELGAWARGPVREAVLLALRRVEAAAPVLEAMQDEEAIDRLVLACRATSLWFTAAAGAPQILWKLGEFLEKPEYARLVIKREGRS